MRILGLLVALNRLIDSIGMLLQFAAVVCGLLVPEAIMIVLRDSCVEYLVQHWIFGLTFCMLLGGTFSWFCMEWSIRLEKWLDEENVAYVDAFATVFVALSAFVGYSLIVRGAGDRLSNVKISEPGGELLIMAIQGWYALWILLFGYSVKVVWDHARKTAKQHRDRAC